MLNTKICCGVFQTGFLLLTASSILVQVQDLGVNSKSANNYRGRGQPLTCTTGQVLF